MQEKATFTVREAANVVGISLPVMYDLTERSDFNALIRIGWRKLILKSRFMKWLDQQAGGGE
jgi:predicted DNA-binding transcriptional regulator AlpA